MQEFPTFTDDLKSELKWLEENSDIDNVSGIKQQKFLLLYNLFLKVKSDQGNFEGLCAWEGGPVYTQVHAAIKHHYSIKEIIESIDEPINIDNTLAKIAKFFVELLSDEEVSEYTHKFDFWKTISNNYENNEIKKESITKSDQEKIQALINFYDIDFINSHTIYKGEHTTFFIKNEDYDFIVNNFNDQLSAIVNDKPVKIELKKDSSLNKEEVKKLSI